MTLGEKIKKYRELRELTQRELGQKVGFSSGTEDSRIRKYEKNMMAPKTDIRRKIAEALDIDMSALNDIDIQTEKDAIRALFYLEEKYGMDIKKTDREIRLTFDIDNTDIWKLIEYLEEWATKKEEYIKKKGNTTGEFQWKIYEKYNGIKKLKAGFVNEMEAREYASFLENCNRMAGYNGSRFSIEYGCPVSEAQEGYDIWKAQFPKNLECTEIRHIYFDLTPSSFFRSSSNFSTYFIISGLFSFSIMYEYILFLASDVILLSITCPTKNCSLPSTGTKVLA